VRAAALALLAGLGSVSAIAEPIPDLTGVWVISKPVHALKTTDGNPPPMTAEAKAVYEQHRAAAAKGDYSFDGVTRCLPPGLPRLMLIDEPFEILEKPNVVYFVHQLNRLPRRAYVDESLPADADPKYLGYSVAHWDRDVLVIESSGFDDSTLLDNSGLPHSVSLHLTERYQLTKDGQHLQARFTIEDSKTFTQTWTAQTEYTKKSGYEIPEEVCADPLAPRRIPH
jgi:hypothetical protein